MNTSVARIIPLIFMALLPMQVTAQEALDIPVLEQWTDDPTRIFDANEINLNDFVWLARPVVIFADSPNDPQFRRQLELFAQRPEDLAQRDVIVITDTSPTPMSDIRKKLRPRGFQMVLIDKDGRVALRKPAPWDLRELSRSIDKSALRQQEIEDRRIVN